MSGVSFPPTKPYHSFPFDNLGHTEFSQTKIWVAKLLKYKTENNPDHEIVQRIMGNFKTFIFFLNSMFVKAESFNITIHS